MLTIAFAFALAFTGCKKDETTTTSSSTTNTGGGGGGTSGSSTTPVYFAPSDASGLLVAGNVAGSSALVTAQFFSTPGGRARTAAGSVLWNSHNMSLGSSDTAYSYFDFSGAPTGSLWEVTAGGSVPAFSHTFNTFPSVPDVTSGTTVNRSAGFTVTWNAVSNADSVYVTITGGSTFKSKLVAATATSCTFTASELSALSATTSGQINVGAWVRTSAVYSSKTYYFYNNGTTIQSAVIQ